MLHCVGIKTQQQPLADEEGRKTDVQTNTMIRKDVAISLFSSHV